MCLNSIAFYARKQEPHSAAVGAPAPEFDKSATELKLKQKLLRCKITVYIVTLNVRTLNGIGLLLELKESAGKCSIDIVCIQEHTYYHIELDIKYHDTGNEWKFISASI